MESWVGTKNLVFCSSYNAPALFRNLQEIFRVQEVVLSKQVTHYGQVRFLYYNLKIPHREASPLSATWGRAEQLCGFNP